MKTDEFAFFNQQLAAMLENGLPLEGALKELCANMQRGALRAEIEALAADLEKGTPLVAALDRRKLPEFYRHMILIGLKANNLPGMLLMLANYYQRANSIWTRLKGLLVYPMLVFICAFLLSCFLSIFLDRVVFVNLASITGGMIPPAAIVGIWFPPVLIGLTLLLAIGALSISGVRRRLRWRVPAFKEAKLAQVASAMELMLKNGGNLGDALALTRQMEEGTPAGTELAVWQTRLSAGNGAFAQIAHTGRIFPPLFVWLVASSGEDIARGFRHAAEIYDARAVHRTETFLYAVLPLSFLLLGAMIVSQMSPVLLSLVHFMNSIDSVGQ